jgi:hypothetical protein
MADKIKIDFKEIGDRIKRFYYDVIEYFKHLTTDMMIAWGAVGLGLILLITGIIIV